MSKNHFTGIAMICVIMLLAFNQAFSSTPIDGNFLTANGGNVYLTKTSPDANGHYHLTGNLTVYGLFEVGPGVQFDFNSNNLVLEGGNYVSINDPLNEGDSEDRPSFTEIGTFQMHDIGEDIVIYDTDFSTTNSTGHGLEVVNSEDCIIYNCNIDYNSNDNYYALAIYGDGDNSNYYDIVNCIINSEKKGILVDGDESEDNPNVSINLCKINAVTDIICLRDLENTGTGFDDEDLYSGYPVMVYQNIIYGNGGNGAGYVGISVDDVPNNNSVLIANNVIYNVPGMGIKLFAGDCAHIFNNAVFTCDIGFEILDIPNDNDNRYDRLRLRQNIAWNCSAGAGIGFRILFGDGATLDDVDFANNIACFNQLGLYMGLQLAANSIKDNAFMNADNVEDLDGEAADAALDTDDANDDDCVLNGFEIKDDWPTSAGWDFHIFVDNIVPGDPDDFNMDVVDSGDGLGGNWMETYNFDLYLEDGCRESAVFPPSPPDMGIFGGPFAKGNIDNSRNILDDRILLADIDFLEVELPPESYKLDESIWPPAARIYRPGDGETFTVSGGTVIDWGPNIIDIAGTIEVDGTSNATVGFIFDEGGYIAMDDTTDTDSYINYCAVVGADFGIHLEDMDNSSEEIVISDCILADCDYGVYAYESYLAASNCIIYGSTYGIYSEDVVDGSNRLEIDNCTFEDCDYGVYADYSNVDIDYCEASGCGTGIKIYGTPSGSTTHCQVTNCTLTENDYGLTCTNQYLDMINCNVYDNDIRGVTIAACSAGKVSLSEVDSYLNGVGGNNRLYSGIYLSEADAELINCEVHDNGCNGVVCMSSSPDMDTDDTVVRPNNIFSNGTGTQSGSTGAEFYLSLTSLPIVNYNNIYDTESSANVGAMMYRYLESTSVGYVINAEHNWWGSVGVDEYDFSWTTMSPPWDFEDVFDIDPEETGPVTTSDFSNLEIAMNAWDAENYTQAASYFEDAIDDGGADALIAVRYLTGCYLKTEGNLNTLRAFYEDVEDESEEQLVQRTARRFMINCLTEMGDFEDAAEEYLDAAEDAYSYDDSIQCVIDYLTVCELGDIEPDGLDAFSRQNKLEDLYLLLDSGNTEIDETIQVPQEFALTNAYPNPFNSTTTIAYSLPEQGDVKLSVFDLNGREVSVLHEGNVTAGNHTASWHANNLPSGLYWCRLESGSQIATMKLTLIK